MTDLDRASLDRILPPTPGSADWDDVLRRAGADEGTSWTTPCRLVAAVLVLVVGTASAFGTVRDLFGNGKPHVARGFYPSEGKRGSFTVRILSTETTAGNGTCGVADRA